MNKITLEQIALIAKDLQVDLKRFRAILAVEAAGNGFDSKTGKIKIQFEPHYFKHYTGLRVPNGVEDQPAEWKAFNYAFGINPRAAMLSTSWGMGQVMGENFRKAGYFSVDAMIDDFKKGEYEQVKGMANFIKSDPIAHHALMTGNMPIFFTYYNGENYAALGYDKKFEKEFKRLKQ